MPDPRPIPILAFADSVLGIQPYPWQCKILLNYEAGNRVAVAASNFTGKTSVIFPICALWTLYCHPRARVQYISATYQQIRVHFFGALERFKHLPAFHGWTWLETEVRTPQGGRLFGRSTDSGGSIEGLHDNPDSPGSLLVDECKSVADDVIDALSRGHTTYRLFASSTGAATGRFYEIMTDGQDSWRTFTVKSSMCAHVDPNEIEADRRTTRDSVFRIKHSAEWLYDAGSSMISLEAVRRLIANPPQYVEGRFTAFGDFAAGGGAECVLASCDGNLAEIQDYWIEPDTMASVGRFLNNFRELELESYRIGGDEGGIGKGFLDRMAEEGFYLQRVNNGSPAKDKYYFNRGAEWWGTVGELIENRQIIIPGDDEKLVKQLTSREKRYDSYGRAKLESKEDMASRGLKSPDRADALIGAVMLGMGGDAFATTPKRKAQVTRDMRQLTQQMASKRSPFAVPFIDFNRWF